MTSTRAINAAAQVVHACIQQGKPLPASIAYALDSAGLLNSPEHAAEVEQLRARVAELEAAAGDGSTRTVDEDPIAYSLTVEALHASSGAVIETPSRREQSSAKLRDLPARQQAAVEAAHETPPRPRPTPHDLPEVTP